MIRTGTRRFLATFPVSVFSSYFPFTSRLPFSFSTPMNVVFFFSPIFCEAALIRSPFLFLAMMTMMKDFVFKFMLGTTNSKLAE